MSYFALILSAINIILFFIFLIKFKSIFSTDSILEKTAKRVDKMIAELNENAQRDLDLLSSSSRKIQKQLDDADTQMQLFHEATQRLREMLAEVENKKESKVFSVVENKEVQNNNSFQSQNLFQGSTLSKASTISQKVNAYKQNENSPNEYNKNIQQPDLFTEEKQNMFINESGVAYKEIPLVVTKVVDEIPKNQKKSLKQSVIELYNQGYTIEQITMELSCSETEVQLIIDMI